MEVLKVKFRLFIFWVFAVCSSSFGLDMKELLNSVANQPDAKFDELHMTKFQAEIEKLNGVLYPEFSANISYEYHNSPVNLRPMPPTEINPALDSIPFSKGILKEGIDFKMPLYLKEIYALKNKIKTSSEQFNLIKKLNIITKQATVLSLNSTLMYLEKNILLTENRIKSLESVREEVKIKVDTGRWPEAEIYKIDNSITKLINIKNQLQFTLLEILKEINILTGIELTASLPMTLEQEMLKGENLKLQIAQKEIDIAQKTYDASISKYYPSFYLSGSFYRNEGEAYNTGNYIKRDFGTVMINLKIPIFDKKIISDVKSSKIDIKKARQKFIKAKQEVDATAKKIDAQMKVVKENINIANKAVENDKKLLEIAKLSYSDRRISTEEYLRYETSLLESNVNVSNYTAQYWKLIAEQAILDGILLSEVIK